MHNVCESLAFPAQKTEETVTNGLLVGTSGREVAIIIRAYEHHTYLKPTRHEQGAEALLSARVHVSIGRLPAGVG